jgi:uncharacterized protein YbbC (DUF1343 family)
MQKTIPGINSFIEITEPYKHARLGLVTNNAAVTSSGEASSVALLKSRFQIKKLFSPEHGLNAKGEDGSFQKNYTDAVTGLPVISLYGDKLKPSAEDLQDIDAVLFDIPDAGCRFYTYLWTMTYIMEACAENNKLLIILDRPNPCGGNLKMAEGPILDEANCSSFIGRWNIPIRHCCTLGELASYFSVTRIKNLQLEIIKIKNWNRNENPELINPDFVPPSPAITDMETVLLYPGMGLLEGVSISEGRGTASPFKIIGAPRVDSNELHKAFAALNIKGIESRPAEFIPEQGPFKGIMCSGLNFMLTDTDTFRPVKTGLQLIELLIKMYPDQCRERLYPTVANPSGKNHSDRLTGVFNSFEKIKSGTIWKEKFWDNEWENIISPYLFY